MKATSLLMNNVIAGTLCVGTFLLVATGAPAQVLYESDLYTGAINEFNSAGTATTFVSSSQPLGEYLAFDSSGDLFVGNNTGPTITKITPNGTVSSFGFGFNGPSGVAVNSAGDVFVASANNEQIIEVSPNGLTESIFASGLDQPVFLAFNNAGDLFEADRSSGNIYEFAPNGAKTLYASGFDLPVALTFDSAGDLFVSSALNGGTVSEITPTGTSTVITDLDNAEGLAFDNAGDLFIALNGPANGSIMEITATGTKETFSTQVAVPEGLAFAPVPEPSTLALLAVGASAVMLRLRRKA